MERNDGAINDRPPSMAVDSTMRTPAPSGTPRDRLTPTRNLNHKGTKTQREQMRQVQPQRRQGRREGRIVGWTRMDTDELTSTAGTLRPQRKGNRQSAADRRRLTPTRGLNHKACVAQAYSAKGFPRRQGYGGQVEGRGPMQANGRQGTRERGSRDEGKQIPRLARNDTPMPDAYFPLTPSAPGFPRFRLRGGAGAPTPGAATGGRRPPRRRWRTAPSARTTPGAPNAWGR